MVKKELIDEHSLSNALRKKNIDILIDLAEVIKNLMCGHQT